MNFNLKMKTIIVVFLAFCNVNIHGKNQQQAIIEIEKIDLESSPHQRMMVFHQADFDEYQGKTLFYQAAFNEYQAALIKKEYDGPFEAYFEKYKEKNKNDPMYKVHVYHETYDKLLKDQAKIEESIKTRFIIVGIASTVLFFGIRHYFKKASNKKKTVPNRPNPQKPPRPKPPHHNTAALLSSGGSSTSTIIPAPAYQQYSQPLVQIPQTDKHVLTLIRTINNTIKADEDISSALEELHKFLLTVPILQEDTLNKLRGLQGSLLKKSSSTDLKKSIEDLAKSIAIVEATYN